MELVPVLPPGFDGDSGGSGSEYDSSDTDTPGGYKRFRPSLGEEWSHEFLDASDWDWNMRDCARHGVQSALVNLQDGRKCCCLFSELHEFLRIGRMCLKSEVTGLDRPIPFFVESVSPPTRGLHFLDKQYVSPAFLDIISSKCPILNWYVPDVPLVNDINHNYYDADGSSSDDE
jgi:hypothetical protein